MAFTVRATAISPKPFDAGRIKREIEYVLEKEGIDDRNMLKKTTEGWSSAPKMDYEIEVKANTASVWIGPTGTQEMIDKWVRIDDGLEDHPIISSTWMIFPWQGRGVSYDAKTTPRQFSSRSQWVKKGTIRKTKRVEHHYITPREWSITLANMRIKPFAENVQAAINRGLAP